MTRRRSGLLFAALLLLGWWSQREPASTADQAAPPPRRSSPPEEHKTPPRSDPSVPAAGHSAPPAAGIRRVPEHARPPSPRPRSVEIPFDSATMQTVAAELTPALLDCTEGSPWGRWEFLLVGLDVDEEGLREVETLTRDGLDEEAIQCIEDQVWEAPWPAAKEGEVFFRQPFPPPG